jgi:predicted RNA binding protein YcfA (HicA-like mRNA interferase family)
VSCSPALTGKQLIKAPKKIGFEVVRSKGSHRLLQHSDGRCTVVPVHTGEAMGRGRGDVGEMLISDEGN